MIDLNTVWFLLVGVLLVGYAILDGFDLGVGALSLFARDERERSLHMKAIGPVWDGNEVWLLTFGGALFAAFPPVYATIASGYYLAIILLLVALIFRAVSLEFHHQVDDPSWQRFWGWSFGVGSLAPALLFGVALGNVLRGLPIDASGELTARFPRSFLGLLNPYALLVGVLSVALLVMHGALYLALKSEGDLRARMARWAGGAWVAFAILYVAASVASVFVSPFLFEGALGSPLFWILTAALVAAALTIYIALRGGRLGLAFFASSGTIATMIALVGWSLYPRIVPSRLDLANSLTIYNASSTSKTLGVMLIVALVGVPLVLIYTAYLYYFFRGPTRETDEGY